MRKNPHGRILRGEPKEQHLKTVPKFCPYINLKLVICKILSIAFFVATFLLSHINITFQFTLVRLNLSKSLSKHKGYEYINVIFMTIIHSYIITFK